MMKPFLIVLSVVSLAGCSTVSGWFSRSASSATANPGALADYQVPDQLFADEGRDYGTPPVSSLIPHNYRGPTPVTLAGGQLIATPALHLRLTSNDPPLLINTLPGPGPDMIPGSVWLSGAGQNGNFNDAVQNQLRQHLETLTEGDRNRLLVFYASGYDNWSAYNAALRAVNMRYPNVRWYRGGLTAWHAAGLPSSNGHHDLW